MRACVLLLIGAVHLSVTTNAAAGDIDAASVLRVVNAHRAEHGLEPLTEEVRLHQAAADRMRDMEEQGYWNHLAPDGMSPFVWLDMRGYRYAAAGENLARGYETVQLLVEGWMESPGHRAVLLSPAYRQAGIAIIDGYTTGRATGKSVVMFFASERSEPIRRISSAGQR